MTAVGAIDQEARDMAQRALAIAESHESLCEERWVQQRAAMVRVEIVLGEIQRRVNTSLGLVPAGAIAALTGLCGFLADRAFPH